jgi:predicted nucleic acid-binding Zn ribbon protein
MQCRHCAKEIPDNSKFCPECGQKLDAADKDKANAKKGCLGCLGFIVIITVVISVLGWLGGNESVPTSVKSGPLADYGRWLITDVVGKKGADGHDTIQLLTGVNGVLATTIVGNAAWDAKSALFSIQMASKEIFERAYSDRKDIQQVFLNWQLPLVDKYGQTSLGAVVKVALNRDTAKRINWDNIFADDMPRWADTWWAHRAVDQ